MAENTSGTGGESSAPVDTGPVTTESATNELEAWANEKPSPTQGRPRADDGKFKAKVDSDPKEVARVLKGTMKAATRPPPKQEQEEEETEPQEEEQEEAPPRPKGKRQVKGIVNGREEIIDLDDDEFNKVNAVQATRAAQKAWREAAQMRAEANKLREALDAAKAQVSQNPMALFEALGIPEDRVLEFAQQQTINKLSETIDPNTGEPYTPEQQRIIQLQRELQRREQAEQKQQMTQEQLEFEQTKEIIRKDIDRKFTSALENTGLPPTPYTMMRLANMMQDAGPDVDPEQLAPLVLEDMVNEVRHTIYSMPMEVAAEVLGTEWMNELRKWDIQKARGGRDKFGRNPQKYPNNAPQRAPQQKNNGKTESVEDATAWLEKWASGR
jgi:hypothetical protein